MPDESTAETSLFALLPEDERSRCEQGAERLRERLSSVPYYAKEAEIVGPIYWQQLYAGRMMS